MAGSGEGELNLIPYMDILTTLIVFTLAVGTVMVDLAAPPVDVPPVGGKGGAERLGVRVGPDGFTLSGVDGAVALGRDGGAWPYAELSTVLRGLRDAGEASTSIQLSASGEIPYDVVIATMDAVRADGAGPLYPGVTLGLVAR